MLTGFPFANRPGECFDHDGVLIRLDRFLGGSLVQFTDLRTLGPYQVEDDEGRPAPTTVKWMGAEYAASRLSRLGPVVSDAAGREHVLAGLDAAAADRHDEKASWRFRWALAASQKNLVSNDDAYREFIAERKVTLVHERFAPPGPSSLRRFVRLLKKHGICHSVFVGRVGRPLGYSQLTATEDLLVHEYAIRFWASRDWRYKQDAYAFLDGAWRELRDGGCGDLSPTCPTYETLRLRINSLMTRETAEAKWGTERAAAIFDGNGEVERATRPFERVFMDGIELPSAAVFSEDLPVAACKMRSVLLFDSVTTFAWAHTFAGPYRSEASHLALLRMLLPPDNLTDEQRVVAPEMAHVWIAPEAIIPDNDKTLISPETVVSIGALGTSVELPRTYHSNGKAEVESFGKLVQARVAGVPGRVLMARPRRDYQRDPLREAELTMHQMRGAVDDVIWEHNTTPRSELGDRSPLQVVLDHFNARGGPVISDRSAIRRSLARTIADRTLDENGIVVEGIRYRNGPEGDVIGKTLRANHARTPMKGRRSDQATVVGDIRVFDWDLDMIEFYDAGRQRFVRLWSDDPDYTKGLDRYAHHLYLKAAKDRGERLDTRGQQLASRRRTLELVREKAPSLSFRERAAFAALWDSEAVRKLSGRRAENGMPPPLPGALPARPVRDTRTRPDPAPPSSTAIRATRAERDGTTEAQPASREKRDPDGDRSQIIDWSLPDDVDDDMED